MASAVDKWAGGPFYPSLITIVESRFSSSRNGQIDEVRFETSQVEAEPLGIAEQVGRLEVSLATKEHVVHLPEPSLACCRLRCHGGRFRVRVDAAQRKLPEYELELGT